MTESLEEWIVSLSSASFLGLDSPWPDFIIEKMTEGLKQATIQTNTVLMNFNREVLTYLEETHGTLGWNGRLVNDGYRLQRRSGGGIESIRAGTKFTEGADGKEAVSTNTTGNMAIHETGGTISARRAKFLTIPLPAACDRRGVPLKASSRDWPNTFVQTSRKGNLIIFQKNADKTITPLYLLKPSVYIRPHMGLEKFWTDRINTRLESALVQALEAALDEVVI